MPNFNFLAQTIICKICSLFLKIFFFFNKLLKYFSNVLFIHTDFLKNFSSPFLRPKTLSEKNFDLALLWSVSVFLIRQNLTAFICLQMTVTKLMRFVWLTTKNPSTKRHATLSFSSEQITQLITLEYTPESAKTIVFLQIAIISSCLKNTQHPLCTSIRYKSNCNYVSFLEIFNYIFIALAKVI